MFKSISTTLPPSLLTAAGDLNGDHKADFVVPSWDSTTISSLLGNGDGTTVSVGTLTPAGGISHIALADVNGDGKLDLIIANAARSGLSVAFGNGDGMFQTPGPSIAADVVNFGMGDLNGDGRADLVTVSSGGIGVVRLGNGDGTFESAVSTFKTAGTTGAVAIGDVTGDGKADIVTTGPSPDSVAAVQIIAGRGDGSLGTTQHVNQGNYATNIALGDVNLDGKLDILIAAANKYLGYVNVIVNDGNGSYLSASTDFGSANIGLTAIQVADIDGNGRPDLVAPSRGMAQISFASTNTAGIATISPDYLGFIPPPYLQLYAGLADAEGAKYADYNWQRSDGFGGFSDIAGANSYYYQVISEDNGRDLRFLARSVDGDFDIEHLVSPKVHMVIGNAAGQALVSTSGDDYIVAIGNASSTDYTQRNTAIFATTVRIENTVTHDATVDTVVGPRGHDDLFNIGNFAFLDGILTVDANGSATVVTRLYEAALGRDPDVSGLSHFTTALEHGTSLRDVALALTASSEFQTHGGTLGNDAFVGTLYQNVLHRAAGTDEVRYWSGQLDSGTARADVILGIAQSSEALQITNSKIGAAPVFALDEHAAQLARLYDTAFGRDPDRGGLEVWRAFLDQGGPGHTLGDVANAFAASSEFVARYGQASTDAYVTALYQNSLDRAPDTQGQAHWVAILNSGAETRAQVALDFSESVEHQNLLAPHIQDGIHLA